MVTAQDIKDFKLFSGLDEKELGEIAQLCKRQTFDRYTLIFHPDNPSSDIFFLESGNDAVQIEVPITGFEDKVVIHTLSKGELFGWTALTEPHIRTATARSIEKISVIFLNGRELMRILEGNHHMGYVVMKNLSEFVSIRLSQTTIAFRHEIRKLRKRLSA
jgi:CRP-like cAMP-binding protein